MKEITFSGTMRNFYGKPLAELKTEAGSNLPASSPYDAKYSKYENISEVKAANDFPSDEKVVKLLNQARKAAARQKAMQSTVDALGAIKPTTANDSQMRLEKMAALFVDNGLSEEDARVKASEQLGIAWDDDDND